MQRIDSASSRATSASGGRKLQQQQQQQQQQHMDNNSDTDEFYDEEALTGRAAASTSLSSSQQSRSRNKTSKKAAAAPAAATAPHGADANSDGDCSELKQLVESLLYTREEPFDQRRMMLLKAQNFQLQRQVSGVFFLKNFFVMNMLNCLFFPI